MHARTRVFKCHSAAVIALSEPVVVTVASPTAIEMTGARKHAAPRSGPSVQEHKSTRP